MLRAIALDAASVVEEILQAWLYIETDMRREVVLETKTEGCGPLKWYAELFPSVIGVHAVVDVVYAESAVYRYFHHHSC